MDIKSTDTVNDLARRYLIGQRDEINRHLATLDGQATKRGPGRPAGTVVNVHNSTEATGTTSKRRQMSPAARKRISAMMKKRWAARRAASTQAAVTAATASVTPTAKPKRRKAKKSKARKQATAATDTALGGE